MSQDKLYLKAERGLSHLLYGDFETGLDATRLGAYNRMFNGAQLVVRGRRAGLRSFLTRTDRTLVVDTLPGQGISGFYSLTNRSIVPGSERVVIETRDRWRPEFVLDRQARQRDLDYDIDYIIGVIRFKGPVPSSDASLNPVYVIVTYEHESQTRNYEIAGGRGTFRPFRDLELGVTNVLERQLAGDFRLEALDMALRLPGKTLVKAEWAKTTSLIDEMGTLDRRSDKARSIEVTSHPTDRLDLGAWYRRAGDAYRNPSAVDVFAGSHRSGGDLSYRLAQDLVFKSQYYLENDDRNEMFYRHTSAGLEKTFRRTRVGLEYVRERADDGYLPPARQGNRQPFDIAEETPDDLTAARITAEHTLNDRMTLELSHKGNLGGRRYRFGQVGMRYQLTPLTRFYVRDEFARFDALTDDRLVMGAESEVARDTVAFSEYRLGRGASEARVQQSLGLRNTFMLGKAATGNVTFERLETTEGKELSQQPDATAVSVGVEYLPLTDLKLSTRFERRLAGTGDTDSIDVGTAWRLHRDLHLLLSDRWYRMTAPAAGRDTASRVVLGLAFRPVAWDRFNALAKLERRDGMTSEMQLGDDSRVILYSLDGVYRLSPRWQMAGRFARKTDQELGFTENTRLASGRVVFDLGRRFDVGAEYRFMKGDTAASIVRGGAVELGARIGKGIWLGVGYSFEEFDADLLGDQYEGRGPFIRIRFRVAEDFLDRKSRRSSPATSEGKSQK
ncbi:MAG TPA: hypothetical protein PLP29_19955, partial [Candidatus Ozemobacteraceae bacterium]|nr:hypothetical protein [Candidatus Ozemobacteraceae bacterium]